MVQLFSIVAMFIMFRETLEACIVVAIMLNLCTKLNLQRAKRQVWWGVITGISLSILIGVAFIIVFYVSRNTIFSGEGKAIFKGYVNLIASFLIAVLGFAMLRFMNYERKWERKLKLAHQRASETNLKQGGRSTNLTIFLLCFSAVFREGIEAVVFLAGVSTTENITAIPIAAVVGIICGLAIGFFLFYTGREIKDLKWFFIISFVVLYMIAAGLVSTGVSSWQTIGWWGTFWPSTSRRWWNQPVWNTCRCCNDNITSNKFFGLMNAIFGYQCTPTFISLFSYFMFWFIIACCILVKWRRGNLTDAEYKSKKREAKRRKKLGLPPLSPEEEAAQYDPEAKRLDSPRASSSISSEAEKLEKGQLAPTSSDAFNVTHSTFDKETELTNQAGSKQL